MNTERMLQLKLCELELEQKTGKRIKVRDNDMWNVLGRYYENGKFSHESKEYELKNAIYNLEGKNSRYAVIPGAEFIQEGFQFQIPYDDKRVIKPS